MFGKMSSKSTSPKWELLIIYTSREKAPTVFDSYHVNYDFSCSAGFPSFKQRLTTSRFRDFCQFFKGFGFGKKVSLSVSENLVSEKKSRFWFRKT